MTKTLILIRATRLTDRINALADQLSNDSGFDVAFILDGRHKVEIPTDRKIVFVTQEACEKLGLYCPSDFIWRCGDYGLYLARLAFPDVDKFWLHEYDVLLTGPKPFFNLFSNLEDHDFLATYFQVTNWRWYWWQHALGRNTVTYRCMFPLLRVSANAIDVMLNKRLAHSKSPFRRNMWPNDEGFTATTLASQGFKCADFNDFGDFYSDQTFSYDRPIDADNLAVDVETTRIFHPALFGEDHRKKVERTNYEQSLPKPKGFGILFGKIRPRFYKQLRW